MKTKLMFAAAVCAILLAMAITLARACVGPTLYDRMLAVNAIGTKTVLLIALLGFLQGRPDFLDIALVYALINFISTIGVLRYFEMKASGDEDDSSAETGLDSQQ